MPLKGSCHCGAIQFEVTEPPVGLTSCNCSFCAKRGSLWAYYKVEQFKLLTARDRVATYQWGHFVGQHHHCGVCGCGAYSEFPSFETGEANYDEMRVSVNARLFGDAFDLTSVPIEPVDGKNGW